MKSAVTISLVPEARGGPFVFHGDLAAGCAKAAALAYDAVEVFPRSLEELDAPLLRRLLTEHKLQLAAVGSGAGWVVHQLRLTDADAAVRRRAQDFIIGIIDFAAGFGAPAILGSMQGRFEGAVTREQAMGWLAEGLEILGERAASAGVPFLYEFLNRYETNLCNRVVDALALVKSLRTKNVLLLCDLFHMNIEEASVADALRAAGLHLGHVHFVDSNRRPAGLGHIDYDGVARALKDIGYRGYLSAEALPFPDSEAAAAQTIAHYRKFFPAV